VIKSLRNLKTSEIELRQALPVLECEWLVGRLLAKQGVATAKWLGMTVIGVGGYILLRRGYRLAGAGLMIAYGCYGLDALAHYALAPISAHSLPMNLTIWLEAATALALLAVVARQ